MHKDPVQGHTRSLILAAIESTYIELPIPRAFVRRKKPLSVPHPYSGQNFGGVSLE